MNVFSDIHSLFIYTTICHKEKEVNRMSNLLFDKHPLVVNPSLAALIGLNEAIVLQQVHYWLKHNEEADKNFEEGRYWTYNTI